MNLKLNNSNIDEYLKSSSIIDYNNRLVVKLAEHIKYGNPNEIDLIKVTFEYVRDEIHHSADIMGTAVTSKASDVLQYKEGFCYAKSHLLAAILRYHGIPAGFCYQKLILDDKSAPYIVIHGLNAVYVSSVNRWVRLDARGNKGGVDAQFNLGKEQLAFSIRQELGEEDVPIIFEKPDENIIQKLSQYDKVEELLKDLPRSLKTGF